MAQGSRRKRVLVPVVLVLALGATLFLLVFKRNDSPQFPDKHESNSETATASDEKLIELKVIDPELDGYGTTSSSPQRDVEIIGEVLDGFWTLMKNPDLLPLGSNREITRFLTGENVEKIAFIPPSLPQINDSGELTDRWGTPIFFHPESVTDIGIRSAGEDREMFTNDDLVFAPNPENSLPF